MKLDGGNDGGDIVQHAPQQKDAFGKASKSDMGYSDYNDITKLNDPYPDLSKQTGYNKWKQNIIIELDKRGIRLTGNNMFVASRGLLNAIKKKNDVDINEAIENTLRYFYKSPDKYDIDKLVKQLEKFGL